MKTYYSIIALILLLTAFVVPAIDTAAGLTAVCVLLSGLSEQMKNKAP